jgi:hypothetical protein
MSTKHNQIDLQNQNRNQNQNQNLGMSLSLSLNQINHLFWSFKWLLIIS